MLATLRNSRYITSMQDSRSASKVVTGVKKGGGGKVVLRREDGGGSGFDREVPAALRDFGCQRVGSTLAYVTQQRETTLSLAEPRDVGWI